MRTDLLYGYFAVDGNQIAETANHVNLVHIPDFGFFGAPGEIERIKGVQIAQLQEAHARGIEKALVSIGFLLFATDYKYRGTADLVAYKTQLGALGLGGMIVGLYPIDEPELHGLTDQTMQQILDDLRVVWPNTALAVIYGNGDTPGISKYDWIGRDDYGIGERVLNELPAIRGDQRWIVVPGGSNPWHQDPLPFLNFAERTPQVAVVMPFVWFDRTDEQGVKQNGIRSDSLANQYCRTGAQVSGRSAAGCPQAGS